MAGLNIKLVKPQTGKLTLGPSSAFGPKSKLVASTAAAKIPTVQPHAVKITHSPAISGLPRGRSAGRSSLGATMTEKAAPGSFSAASAVAKVLNSI